MILIEVLCTQLDLLELVHYWYGGGQCDDFVADLRILEK